MSALARWFRQQGKYVAGYDRTETVLTKQLITEGIQITYEDSVDAIPDRVKDKSEEIIVIYTPAIPSDNEILNFFTERKYTLKKRSEILGEISRHNFTIAVAGTHGKTTTSSLIAHILKEANLNTAAFLGGIIQNYDSNLIINVKSGHSLKIVVEADEYDRSFKKHNTDIAVVTSL